MSWAESKWVIDSLLQKIGQAPNNMRAFSAFSVSKNSIGLKFSEPADSYVDGNLICSVGGVMIRMSDSKYPATISDGQLVIDNTDLGKYQSEAFVVNGLIEGKNYYFSAFPYSSQGVYNLSTSNANRAIGTPADGEKVTVSITIDDTSAFNHTTVTCVDETDATATQTATVTPTIKTAKFTVPIGDTYHIEYGAVTGYSKPNSTASKVSIAGTSSSYTGAYYYFTGTIDVVFPIGATLTCTCGSTVYTAETSTGSYQFKVHSAGTWIIKAVSGAEEASTNVVITADGQSKSVELSFVKIYGISRTVTNSSVAWSRTDDSVGKTATASIGTTAGRSDFDNCYPWSDMKRETRSTGDIMVKIPTFYFQRYVESGVEHIRIADKATEGFAKHPGSGKYIGAYKTSSNNKSVSGVAPTVSQTRATMRTNAKAKGSGWSLIDKAAESAVQMLLLVEFATNNAQSAIGRGYCDGNSSALNSGSCNNVPNLTGRPSGTDGKTDVVYRGIEGFWGNIWEWVDGINFNNGTYHVCTDPSRYADDTASYYTALNYTGATNWGGSYITTEGMDVSVPWAMLPSAAGSGSESTYYTDACWSSTGWKVCQRGGGWGYGSSCGLFTVYLSDTSSAADTGLGSRLLYSPS